MFHGIQYIPPVQNPAEYRMHIIQMGLSFVRYEKLRFVGVDPRVGHGDDAAFVVCQVRMEFVGEGPSPDGVAALARPWIMNPFMLRWKVVLS